MRSGIVVTVIRERMVCHSSYNRKSCDTLLFLFKNRTITILLSKYNGALSTQYWFVKTGFGSTSSFKRRINRAFFSSSQNHMTICFFASFFYLMPSPSHNIAHRRTRLDANIGFIFIINIYISNRLCRCSVRLYVCFCLPVRPSVCPSVCRSLCNVTPLHFGCLVALTEQHAPYLQRRVFIIFAGGRKIPASPGYPATEELTAREKTLGHEASEHSEANLNEPEPTVPIKLTLVEQKLSPFSI